ncbi:helix-turn-helix domain-containing protein [Xanthomonas sp. XNM01]|uniref:helix-turn-helix domain-containing protein n=1 Tax=Xanthomonas sp. XNM01 TaxID=2769289 RepID=UPI00177AD6B0|nr:helix-turn-helix domain-containing protein [Xanthomonas sp. XNM01]MBD9368410.1 helix-turn-helix domain-containing protein [Xanthomonas sp. XNM01]
MLGSYLLFFFAGLGAFNGIALSVYLLTRRPLRPAQAWLAVLVLMLSLRTGKSVLFYFWPDISKLVLQIGLTACFFIGVCLVGFVRAWGDPERRKTRYDAIVALGLFVLATAFGLAYPYADHVRLWAGPVWGFIQLGWLACLLAATALFLRAPAQARADRAAGALAGSHVASVIAGVAVIWLAYATAGLTSYIVGALSFSMVLYLSISVALARRRSRPVAEPYHDRKIAQADAEAPLRALRALMVDECLYKDAGLTLAKLARRLNMPPARLSQLLNDNHRTAFKPYLAGIRIEAAKQLLRTQAAASMEQVAEASGFLSTSTFYRSFSKVEGTTPAAWRQAQLRAAAGS